MKATSTTRRAKGLTPRAGKRAVAKSTPVVEVVSVDITADVVGAADVVDDVVTISTHWPVLLRGPKMTLERRSRQRFFQRSLT